MRASGNKNWGSACVLVLLLGVSGLWVGGCGLVNNNANGIGCGLAGSATPGLTPVAPGSEFVFAPNALCSPGVANDVMSVLTLAPDGTFNNGPVPLVETGNEPVWAVVDPTNHFVYVTNLLDNTVSGFTLDTTTGAVAATPGSPYIAGIAPAEAAVDPSGTFLYVANEGSSTVSGRISGYKISANGSLTAVPGSPFTPATGLSPQQGIAVTAGFVYVSNIVSNNVSAFSFNPGTGALTQLPTSPFTLAPALNPQPESLAMDPLSRFLFTANMTANNVSAFTANGDGSLTQATGSPFGTGFSSPQYLATDQTGKFLYVVNVDNNSVTAYSIAANGTLTEIGVALSTGNFPEGVAVDPANKVAMVANCEDGDLSVYDINGDGTLTSRGPLTSNAITACPQMVATSHLP